MEGGVRWAVGDTAETQGAEVPLLPSGPFLSPPHASRNMESSPRTHSSPPSLPNTGHLSPPYQYFSIHSCGLWVYLRSFMGTPAHPMTSLQGLALGPQPLLSLLFLEALLSPRLKTISLVIRSTWGRGRHSGPTRSSSRRQSCARCPPRAGHQGCGRYCASPPHMGLMASQVLLRAQAEQPALVQQKLGF